MGKIHSITIIAAVYSLYLNQMLIFGTGLNTFSTQHA